MIIDIVAIKNRLIIKKQSPSLSTLTRLADGFGWKVHPTRVA